MTVQNSKMSVNPRVAVAVLAPLCIFLTAYIAYNAGVDSAGPQQQAAVQAAEDNSAEEEAIADTAHGAHSHSGLDVAGWGAIPSVEVSISADSKSGWNLKADVENFVLAPQSVSTENVEGEGHMHLYVDGVKITRMYDEWHHIDGLSEGRHEIRVELSANDHSVLTANGVPIDDTVVIGE